MDFNVKVYYKSLRNLKLEKLFDDFELNDKGRSPIKFFSLFIKK